MLKRANFTAVVCMFSLLVFACFRPVQTKQAKPNSPQAESNERIGRPNTVKFNDLSSQKGCSSTVPSIVSPDQNYKLVWDKTLCLPKIGFVDKISVVSLANNKICTAFFSHPPVLTKESRALPFSFRDYCWAPDSSTVAYIATTDLVFVNIKSGVKAIWKNKAIPYPRWVRYSPDGRYIAISGSKLFNGNTSDFDFSQTLVVVDALNKKIVWTYETYAETELAWSPNGQFLTAICDQSCLQSFDAHNQFKNCMIIYDLPLALPVWSPDGKYLAAFDHSGPQIDVFDKDGNLVFKFPAGKAIQLSWMPDKKSIAYLGVGGYSDQLAYKYATLNQDAKPKTVDTTDTKYANNENRSVLPRYGYLQKSGTAILPNEYSVIKEFQDGTIVAGDFDLVNPKLSPTSIKLFSKDGIQINFGLSKKYRIMNVEGEQFLIEKNCDQFPDQAGTPLRGLCDKTGKVLLEPEYSWIWNGSTKFILAIDALNKFYMFNPDGKKVKEFGRRWYFDKTFFDPKRPDLALLSARDLRLRLFNSVGKEIPDALSFRQSFFSNSKRIQIAEDLFVKDLSRLRQEKWSVEDKTGKIKFDLPAEIVQIQKSSGELIPYTVKREGEPKFDDSVYKMGYLSLDGKVAIEPKFLEAESFKNGLAVVTVNYKSGKRHVGIIDRLGNFVVQPEYSEIEITTSGNFITAKCPDGHFSSVDWKSKTKKCQIDLNEEFAGLLRDYDLIGMERMKLYSLLGEPGKRKMESRQTANEISYTTKATGCINQHHWVVFQFENNRVKRWAYICGGFSRGDNKWNEENVVFSYRPKFYLETSIIPNDSPSAQKTYIKSEVRDKL